MPQTKTRKQAPQAAPGREDRFDRIVEDALRKSVVVAPSDPTGGQKLPQRQANAAKRKVRGKEQYPAIFDREAQESNEQLDEWEDDTNETTDSPEDIANDDDDTPEDPDEQDEDSRGAETYDPYSDDDGEFEEDGKIPVRAHRRRKGIRKAAVADDHTEEDDTLSNDDDDDDDDEDGDEDEDETPARRPAPRKPKERKDEGEERRRSEVRKAMGRDFVGAYDGVPVLKALTDGLFDRFDGLLSELSEVRAENRRLHKALRHYIEAENSGMAKALATGMARTAAPAQGFEPEGTPDAVRKGLVASGEGLRTTGKPFPGADKFNLAKALDVLDESLQKGLITSTDTTVLENDRHWGNLSPAAKNLLHQAGLI